MDLPKRKPTRLKNYNYSSHGSYFITICVKDRKNLLSFVGEGSPLPLLSPEGRIVDSYISQIPSRYAEIKIDKYVIMPDHIHILLSVTVNGRGNPSPTITNAIGWFKYISTKEINAYRSSPGEKVFQRSYYDHIIRGEEDYLETWNYIDSNPGRLWEKHIGLQIKE